MTEKIFFPGKPREPHSSPASRLDKTFFDVHIENMSKELRGPLLQIMVDHGLAKDDPGLVFGMVFFSIQKCVSEIPVQAEAAVHRASERAAEKMDEQSARLFNGHARMLDEHALRLEKATTETLGRHLVEYGKVLEKRVLDGFEERLNKSLAGNFARVAEGSAAALKGALNLELDGARSKMEALTATAVETRALIRWIPWWLLGFFGAACLAIGWFSRVYFAG